MASGRIGKDKIGREPVRRYLEEKGGSVISPTGMLTSEIARATGHSRDSLGRLLADMETDGEIVREVRGRRTFRIALRRPGEEPERIREVLDLLTRRHQIAREKADVEDRLESLLGGVIEDFRNLTVAEIVERLQASPSLDDAVPVAKKNGPEAPTSIWDGRERRQEERRRNGADRRGGGVAAAATG